MDVTFAFEPILSISVRPIGAPAQIVAPTTIQVGLVGIVLVGGEAGGTVLSGKRSDQDFSHIDYRGEAGKIDTLCILQVSKALNTMAVSFLICLSFMFSL